MSTKHKHELKAHSRHAPAVTAPPDAPGADEKMPHESSAPPLADPGAVPKGAETRPAAPDPRSPLRKVGRQFRWLSPLAVILVAAALVFGIARSWNSWVGAQANQKTDDAQLRADITPLSTKVSGTVARVLVQDYQHVRAGDLLVELKNSDYRAQVGEAAAGVEGAKASIDNNRRQKELQDARIEAARTAIDAAKADISRGQAAIGAARADELNAASTVDAAVAAVASAQADIEVSKASIMAARGSVDQARASVDASQANIEAAEATQAAAEAGVENARQSVQAVEASILGAQAEVVRTRRDRARQTTLVAQGYQAQLRQAQAAVTSQQAQVRQATAAVGSSRATQREAQAALTTRQADLSQAEAALGTRQAALRNTRAQLEGRRSEVVKTRSQRSVQEAALEQARAQLAGRGADLLSQQRQQHILDAQGRQLVADLHSRQEMLNFARASLEYTRILAPTDGMVGERKVRAGQLVSPGTQVLSLVQGTLWVQANYKETQLTHVRPGDAAEATVDAFPGLVLRGRVEEIAPASGAQFALLPPDNATGNYTKITQRIPVKIGLNL